MPTTTQNQESGKYSMNFSVLTVVLDRNHLIV